ncbi:MAG: hypothetical protein WBW16_14525 [Bacteroidota bacterium]
MAIKRLTLEIDDSPESSPTTGAMLEATPSAKAFTRNETTAVEHYDDNDATKVDKLKSQKTTTGRTFGDILVEFKDDPRFMTVFLVVVSFVVFINKLDSVSSFHLPLALSVLLNAIWHFAPLVIRKRASKQPV